MANGFDCATAITAGTAAAFAADGYAFVARYLVPSSWKALTAAEAATISAAGLQIVSVFETAADRALGGGAAGLADGAVALGLARQMGQPEGSAIYAAVDFPATAAQMPVVIAYIRAFSEATPGYLTGVYGSYDVVEAVHAAGACSRFWQTYAWSGGRKSQAANIYQYENDITVNGIRIDRDVSYGNEGWWNLNGTGPYTMSAADANKVIAFLAAGYEATDVPEAKAEFHRLGNALRTASVQPLQ